MAEKKLTAKQRYDMRTIKQYKLACMRTTEADIIARLEAQSNKAGYIKRLIREDMEREKRLIY